VEKEVTCFVISIEPQVTFTELYVLFQALPYNIILFNHKALTVELI
jgi:hypothetical protein